MKQRLSASARRLARGARLLNFGVQLIIFLGAGLGAFLLRFEFSVPRGYLIPLLEGLAVWAVVKSLVFRYLRVECRSLRFFSLVDAVRLAKANLLGSAISAVVLFAFGAPGFPRSILVIDFLLCAVAGSAAYGLVRVIAEAASAGAADGGKTVLIYGAGEAGVMLHRETLANPDLGYQVAGFVDDDPRMRGLYVRGVRVFGPGAELRDIVAETGAELILIALPSAGGEKLARVLGWCNQAGVRFRTIPALAEIVEGQARATEIRDVDVQDLLCRTPVRLEQQEILREMRGRVVMVTGAAGSIGSELCRQVARFGPAEIVGFEISETALFNLEREMRDRFPAVRFHPEIGNVQNHRRVSEVLKRYKPSTVFHAAAYKHVPMMESQVFEALENNVFGTYNLALAAAEQEVENFVLISSDKAVRPVSVMGATKRLCELAILSLQDRDHRFVAVRFGNVLGSNGSVIPLFKEQIAGGGPVTVTDPEMRRYFMTIPEAAQLVLQAATMGQGGEVFMLDMGQPVKITDLARNLILLSGLRPGVDIKIEFTGVRPGEKLFEELNFFEEETLSTRHEKIRVFAGNGLHSGDMSSHIRRLRAMCDARDMKGVILLLKDIIPEYNPSSHVLCQMLALEPTAGLELSVPRPRCFAAAG